LEYTGPYITFSIREASTSFKSTSELLKELFKTAEMTSFPLPTEWDSNESLRDWLNKLSSMADYNAGGGVKRKALANKVLSFLQLAINDPAFKGVFFTVIREATTTCGDRMALSILNLGIAYKLSTADKKDLKGLATLLTRGSLALEWLAEVASNKVLTLAGCDPIEVYLGYPVMLKEELKLPIDVQEMLYFACSSLKKEDLETAKQIVLNRFANKEELYKELCKRDLWINALKENYPEKAQEIEAKKQALLEQQNYDFKEVEAAWIDLTKKALAAWDV
jgi:hypothetical protein